MRRSNKRKKGNNKGIQKKTDETMRRQVKNQKTLPFI